MRHDPYHAEEQGDDQKRIVLESFQRKGPNQVRPEPFESPSPRPPGGGICHQGGWKHGIQHGLAGDTVKAFFRKTRENEGRIGRLGEDLSRITSYNVCYTKLLRSISIHPEETLSLRILRKGQAETVSIKPDLDKKTGSGKIGIYPYIPLIVGSVKGGSAAQTADLREGDRITAVNGVPVEHFLEFDRALASRNNFV